MLARCHISGIAPWCAHPGKSPGSGQLRRREQEPGFRQLPRRREQASGLPLGRRSGAAGRRRAAKGSDFRSHPSEGLARPLRRR